MKLFEGQTAVVTGAGSGIGRSIALGLAAQGARLCLVGRELKKLEKVAQSIRSETHRVSSYSVDLLIEAEIESLACKLKLHVGQIDILIHCAGVISIGSFEEATVEDFDRQFKVNARAPYILTRSLLPMIMSCQGQIVFINSSAGLIARANIGQYAASKHALKAIADSLREEVNPNGIRILSVLLGRTATPMQAAVFKMEGKAYCPEQLLQPEDVATIVISSLGLPKTAEVTDISIRSLKKF